MSVQSLAIQPPVHDSAVASRRFDSSNRAPTSRASADKALSDGTFMPRFSHWPRPLSRAIPLQRCRRAGAMREESYSLHSQ